MTIEIVITDPTSESPRALRALADMLLTMAGGKVQVETHTLKEGENYAPSAGTVMVQVQPGGAGGGGGWAKRRIDAGAFEAATTTIAPGDRPDTGAAPSAAPLPPAAPSTAAADLFPSAPAAPPVGAPLPPSVPVPPVSTAPAAVAPSAPAAPTNLADVDSDGLPWDARIHSGSREKNKDNTWRRRRNLDDAELARVTAELRNLMAIPVGGVTIPAGEAPPLTVFAAGAAPAIPAAPSTAAATQPPAPPVAEQAPNVPPVPAPTTSAPAIAATPTPPAPPALTATAPSVPATGNPFSHLMTKITSNVAGGRLTEAQVHQALIEQGLQPNQIAHLAARHDLAANVSARLDVFLAGGA